MAEATEGFSVLVGDAGGGEGLLECVAVVLRVVSGFGNRTDVDEASDAVRFEHFQQGVDRSSGMADCADEKIAHGFSVELRSTWQAETPAPQMLLQTNRVFTG